VAVQRSARQGHVNRREIELMRRLVPHLSQAVDVTRRLRSVDALRRSLEQALNWLADGVVLIDSDGKVLYANAAMTAIAASGDGIALKQHQVEFAAVLARQRYASACAAIRRLLSGEVEAGGDDFAVLRCSGAPAYLVSIRPIPGGIGRQAGVA